jgi:hypothetical protein
MQDYINFLLGDIAVGHRPKDYYKKSRKNSPEEDLAEALEESEKSRWLVILTSTDEIIIL